MVNPTDRLDLNRYGAGDSNWSHSDTVETVDELAIERGAIADRPTSGNYDDELYLATDQQILYRWDETATDWIVEGVGSETDPLPKIWANEIDAESVSTEEASVNGPLDAESASVSNATINETVSQQPGLWQQVGERIDEDLPVNISFDAAEIEQYKLVIESGLSREIFMHFNDVNDNEEYAYVTQDMQGTAFDDFANQNDIKIVDRQGGTDRFFGEINIFKRGTVIYFTADIIAGRNNQNLSSEQNRLKWGRTNDGGFSGGELEKITIVDKSGTDPLFQGRLYRRIPPENEQ